MNPIAVIRAIWLARSIVFAVLVDDMDDPVRFTE